MPTTITAILEPAGDPYPIAGARRDAVHSLVDRDEFGPITGRPGGVFTASTVPLALEPRDELGRRIAGWVPDPLQGADVAVLPDGAGFKLA